MPQTTLLKGVLLCLLLISCTSCDSIEQSEIAEYNNRPDLGKWCVADGEGNCEDGEALRPTKNMFCVDPNKALDGQDHLEKMELYRWKCKEKGKCERKKKRRKR